MAVLVSLYIMLSPLYGDDDAKENLGRFIDTIVPHRCHQTTNRSTAKDEILTGSYIDPTKTRFPLADYSQSVDKWIPPDSADYTIPVIDSATQQRYFNALKSHYFGMTVKRTRRGMVLYYRIAEKKRSTGPGCQY
ncbi:NLP/P60 domain-containing protein [Salmonella enterica subsp. enterica]|uniref:NLP/P60 domain-containing protein n=1 Tax=Salmonella enterica I TaxID=59201 RepID=A0A379WRM9_SALET|nr:NLP/P60 domain-containing protein [Salmonella enterica subsp. enterica]